MERDFILTVAVHDLYTISTHTLTWSVTKHGTNVAETFAISTHTLTWSVTKHRTNVAVTFAISTHTLTWSVTTVRTGSPTRLKFQLTRSRGA